MVSWLDVMGCWSCIFLLCTIYTLIVLLLSYTLPFSLIFRRAHSYEALFKHVERATKLRLEAANEYFNNLDHHASLAHYNSRLERRNLTFAVGIITIQRTQDENDHKSLGYLTQSAALMDQALKQHPFFNSTVPFICNVDVFPQKHLDAVELYKFMPFTERYGQSSMGTEPLKFPNSDKYFRDVSFHSSKYEKETFDYTFCLLSAAALKPEYILLIEDDSLPHKDFPSVLEHLMNSRLKLTDNNNHKRNFAYLKLYYPSKWQGFAYELTRILDLLSWSLVGASVFVLVYLSYAWQFRHKGYQNQTRVFFTGFLVALVTCWLLGRQNINELRRLSKHFYRLQSSEGCCTQAMLYPLHIVDSLSQYLSSSGIGEHTDLAILDFSSLYALPTLQVEPSLFYHAGLHTTLDLTQKHPEEFILPI